MAPCDGCPGKHGQRLNDLDTETLQPLLPEEEAPELVMPLQALPGRVGQFEGYRRLELIVDSGAAASVLPVGMLDDYSVKQGEAARKGVHYLTADGGRVPNVGETRLRLFTKEKVKCNVNFQVAEIQTPTLSVGTLTAMGNTVNFTRFGGTILHQKTKQKFACKRKGAGSTSWRCW